MRSWVAWSAGCREREGFAHVAHSIRRDGGQMVDEAALADDAEVIEAEHAVRGHAIGGAERDLGGNAANSSGGWDGEELIEHGNALVASQDEIGPSLLVGRLMPPDLAVCYHWRPAWRSSSSRR